MVHVPASIRYKNPGAMWGSPLAIHWGANSKAVQLNDGLGQGNNIAVFPTYVQGICAQLDLWRTSKNYKNKKFSQAIKIWSGGNGVESYISFVLSRVPGMTRDTVMDDAFWHSDKGVAFLKAQAWHEAGKKYPAPDEDFIKAQDIVLSADPHSHEHPPAPNVPKSQPVPSPTAPEPAPEKSIWKRAKKWVLGLSGGGVLGTGAGLTLDANTILAFGAVVVSLAVLALLYFYVLPPRRLWKKWA